MVSCLYIVNKFRMDKTNKTPLRDYEVTDTTSYEDFENWYDAFTQFINDATVDQSSEGSVELEYADGIESSTEEDNLISQQLIVDQATFLSELKHQDEDSYTDNTEIVEAVSLKWIRNRAYQKLSDKEERSENSEESSCENPPNFDKLDHFQTSAANIPSTSEDDTLRIIESEEDGSVTLTKSPLSETKGEYFEANVEIIDPCDRHDTKDPIQLPCECNEETYRRNYQRSISVKQSVSDVKLARKKRNQRRITLLGGLPLIHRQNWLLKDESNSTSPISADITNDKLIIPSSNNNYPTCPESHNISIEVDSPFLDELQVLNNDNLLNDKIILDIRKLFVSEQDSPNLVDEENLTVKENTSLDNSACNENEEFDSIKISHKETAPRIQIYTPNETQSSQHDKVENFLIESSLKLIHSDVENKNISRENSSPTLSNDLSPPPLPPKSWSFREKKRSQIESEESTRRSVPPALPPKLSNSAKSNAKISSLINKNLTSFENDIRRQKLSLISMTESVENVENSMKFCRSISSDACVHPKKKSNEKEVRSEPSSISRNTANSVINKSDKIDLIKIKYLQNFQNSEARLQHYPVSVDSTHHRLSEISSNKNIHELFSFDNDSFSFSKDPEIVEAVNIECLAQTTKTESTGSSTEESVIVEDTTDSVAPTKWNRKVLKHSTSTRISNKFKRDIPMYQRGASVRPKKPSLGFSSSNLLENACPEGSQITPNEPKTSEYIGKKNKFLFPSLNNFHLASNLKSHLTKLSSQTSLNKDEERENFLRSQSERVKMKEKFKDRKSRNKTSLVTPTFIKKSFVRNPAVIQNISADSPLSSNDTVNTLPDEEFQSTNVSLLTEYYSSNSSFDNHIRIVDADNTFTQRQRFHSDSSSNPSLEIKTFSDKSTALKTQAIDALVEDMKCYLATLRELQETYSIMRAKTPDGIRQHFDQAFEEIKVMIHLQETINEIVISSNYNIKTIARGFLANDFNIYRKYTVLAHTIQKEMKTHFKYFQENFKELASKILIPSRRLNIYAMHFKNFLDIYCAEDHEQLKDTVQYFENLKDQANTEMTINVIQNCPIELRLSGLIKESGEFLLNDAHSIKKRPLQIILFSDIMVIAENKFDYLIYKTHLRSGQLMDVTPVDTLGFNLKVTKDFLEEYDCHRLKAKMPKERDRWLKKFQNWKDMNRSSYLNTSKNLELHQSLPTSPERFWSLDLWLISPTLKEVVDRVKNNTSDMESNLEFKENPFEYFIKQEEKYIAKLNIFLDPEAMPPPPILGSVLRKLRRLHNGSFLPKLKEAYAKEQASVLDCFIGNIPNFPSLYKEFIEIRAGLTLTLQDGDNVRLYVYPFAQLAFYAEWLHCMSLKPKYHPVIRGETCLLLNCIEDARVTLLHSAIPKTKLDFYKSGNILLKGFLEARNKVRNLKLGNQYYVILFEKMVVFTRLNLPHYDFIQEIWLDQITLGPNMDSEMCFKIEERSAKKEIIYELKAETKAEKTKWLKLINNLLTIQAEIIRKT